MSSYKEHGLRRGGRQAKKSQFVFQVVHGGQRLLERAPRIVASCRRRRLSNCSPIRMTKPNIVPQRRRGGQEETDASRGFWRRLLRRPFSSVSERPTPTAGLSQINSRACTEAGRGLLTKKRGANCREKKPIKLCRNHAAAASAALSPLFIGDSTEKCVSFIQPLETSCCSGDSGNSSFLAGDNKQVEKAFQRRRKSRVNSKRASLGDVSKRSEGPRGKAAVTAETPSQIRVSRSWLLKTSEVLQAAMLVLQKAAHETDGKTEPQPSEGISMSESLKQPQPSLVSNRPIPKFEPPDRKIHNINMASCPHPNQMSPMVNRTSSGHSLVSKTISTFQPVSEDTYTLSDWTSKAQMSPRPQYQQLPTYQMMSSLYNLPSISQELNNMEQSEDTHFFGNGPPNPTFSPHQQHYFFPPQQQPNRIAVNRQCEQEIDWGLRYPVIPIHTGGLPRPTQQQKSVPF
ncbi:unnamed protein product [Cyprideis torosa]|uniref:Uncharacterized protein n=1 Tax=Cyprideis torosa TaxID=163714 RepID=A0A7R8ZPY1_9CRUS|nr:unnamed protein product [Cyprideis torosa]CAG0890878.1 unnamed protein product [Cyprideis torosa]